MPLDHNPVIKKHAIAKLFHENQDPGNEFEMSEWFNVNQKQPPGNCLVILKQANQIFKAFHFPPGSGYGWCTWFDGYAFTPDKDCKWAFLRHLEEKDRPEFPAGDNRFADVKEWKKIRSQKKMSR